MSPRAGTAIKGAMGDDEAEEEPVSPVIFFDDDEVVVPVTDEGVVPVEDEAGALPVGDEAPSPSVSPSAGPRAWVASHAGAVVMAGVAVVLAVVLVLTLMTVGNRDALNGARSSALAAARTDAVELAGYNYQHLNADFAVVMAKSTPTFRRSFTQSSNALKGTLTRFHATAVAHVVSAGIVSATTSRAVALVFLTQKIKNTTQSGTTTDRSQVEITLVRSQGRWLIDQVTLL
jgi:Mce-associated membrane protein